MPILPGLHLRFGTVTLALVLLLLSVAPLAFAQGNDPMAGSFSDGFLTIHINGHNGRYSGQFEAGGIIYPFNASGNAQRIDGTYQDAGQMWQFSAALQGNSMTFQNGSQTFQLTRVGAAQQNQAAAGGLPAGTRLTYNHSVSSTPGTNAGPDARGVAGQGFIEVDIHYSDATACVATLTTYARGLMVDTLTVSGTEYLVSDGNSCGGYWMAPALLAAYQAPPGGIETVERGPYQFGGRTYNALYITKVYQNLRSWRVFDLDSGMLLAFTEATGDRSNPDGTSQGPATSAVQELVSVRQLDLPWTNARTLPAQMQYLQSLSYSGQIVQAMPGITMWDSSVSSQINVVFTVQQRHPAWLQMESRNTMSMMGSPLPAEVRQVVAVAGSGHFIAPDVAAQLRPGQELDVDPITGYRRYVERVDQGGIVLVTEGRGYRAAATFDPGSGLLTGSQSETQEEQSVRTITLQLSSWQ